MGLGQGAARLGQQPNRRELTDEIVGGVRFATANQPAQQAMRFRQFGLVQVALTEA